MLEISIDPTREQIKHMAQLPHTGTITMLNLLKFREKALGTELSGKELYAEYGKKASPFLKASGGKVIWKGSPAAQVIAPESEVEWNEVLLVEYPSISHFLTMIKNPEYPSELRTRSLADARLVMCYPES